MARILIVEDLVELADEMHAAVPGPHAVVRATSRSNAVDELGRAAADVVITSLVLETGDYDDGVKVTREALKRNPACRVIIVCSYSTPETCTALIAENIFAYIERNSPGIDFIEMLKWQVRVALDSRPADGVRVP